MFTIVNICYTASSNMQKIGSRLLKIELFRFNLDKASPLPLYFQAAKRIIDMVDNGVFETNEKLPTEFELSELLKINRMTARQIYNYAMKEGYVYKIKGRGTFVSEQVNNYNGTPRRNVGIVLPNIEEISYFAEILHGIEEALTKADCNMVLRLCGFDSAREEDALNSIFDKNENMLGSIVYMNGDLRSSNNIEKLLKNKRNIVLLDRYIKGVPSDFVSVDNETGAFRLVEKLISKGYSKIFFVFDSPHLSSIEERLRGYQMALKKHKFPFKMNYLIKTGSQLSHFASGYEAMTNILRQKQKPDAVFFSNDSKALGGIRAAKELGFRIPDDIAVAGFDDIQEGERADIPLTTVSYSRHDMGRKAVELLLNPRIKDRQVFIPAKIIGRKSA